MCYIITEFSPQCVGNSWLSTISPAHFIFYEHLHLCIFLTFSFSTFGLAVIFPVCEFEETFFCVYFFPFTHTATYQTKWPEQPSLECVIAALLPVDIKNNNSFDTKSGSEFPGDVD